MEILTLSGVTFANINWITADVSSAVPEPSTWAMTLIGFAGIGFAGYWRNRKSAVVAAVHEAGRLLKRRRVTSPEALQNSEKCHEAFDRVFHGAAA
jgi:hypothetical protein